MSELGLSFFEIDFELAEIEAVEGWSGAKLPPNSLNAIDRCCPRISPVCGDRLSVESVPTERKQQEHACSSNRYFVCAMIH